MGTRAGEVNLLLTIKEPLRTAEGFFDLEVLFRAEPQLAVSLSQRELLSYPDP